MNFHLILLSIHIFGAVAIALYGGYILWQVIKGLQTGYKDKAINLAWLTLAESISGSLLTFFQPDRESVLAFCAKIGIYIVLVGVIEYILYLKMNPMEEQITASHVKWAFSLSITSIIITATFLV